MLAAANTFDIECDSPYPRSPHICRSLLLQESYNLLHLAPPRRSIVEKITQLARIRLHVDGALSCRWVAFQDEHLMLRPTSLRDRIHDG